MTETVTGKVPSDSMQMESKVFHTGPHSTTNTIIQNMAQPVTSFRTTTPSTAMTGRKTTEQVNPAHIHPDTPCKASLEHCMHVHQPAAHVCKPGELLALRKVKHPHNGRTSVNRLPLTKQDIYHNILVALKVEDIFQGTHTNFTSNQNTSLHDMHQGKFQSTLNLLLRRKLNL